MSQHIYKPSVTTASGSWSGTTAKIFPGICCQVYAKSNSDDTTFDMSITNRHGVEQKKWTNACNVINDMTKWPMQDVNTVAISNASADESFTIFIVVEEF